MRRFRLIRDEDPSGVSGTGHVAEGVHFANGKVVLAWLTHTSSLGVYDSMAEMEAIHGHNGATRVVWVDGEPTKPIHMRNFYRFDEDGDEG